MNYAEWKTNKEGLMKKILAAVFILAVSSQAALANAPRESDSVTARATVEEGYANFIVRVLDSQGQEKTGTEAKTLEFGTIPIGSDYRKALDYLGVTVNANYGEWNVDVYSDNFPDGGAPTSGDFAAEQYGGLIRADGADRLPLAWCVFDNPFDEPAGDPTATRTIYADATTDPSAGDHEGLAASRWIWLKDKADAGTSPWDGAQADGYAQIIFGQANNWGWITNPLRYEMDGDYHLIEEGKLVPANDALTIIEDDDSKTASEFYVYLQAVGAPSGGEYEGTIGLDLYIE